MALMMECDACLHAQMVAQLPNGRCGYPDPRRRCERCPSVGHFSLPGAAARLRRDIDELAGGLDRPTLNAAQRRVLDAVRVEAARRGGPVPAIRVRELVLRHVSGDSANRALSALVAAGLLRRPARGRYLPV